MMSLFPIIFSLFALVGAESVTESELKITRLDPKEGELTWLLKDQFSNNRNDSRKTLVMLDARWCGACKNFITMTQTPDLKKALTSVTLVTIDIDTWGRNALKEAGLAVKKIPSFFRIQSSGYPHGKPITPQSWPNNRPSEVAKVLREFLKEDSNF